MSRPGGCFCGAVRYQVTGTPLSVFICHCASCRKASGAAMVPWATFHAADFSVTQGALQWHASSPGVTRGHCARCGTGINYRHAAKPDEIDITLASLDDPATLRPVAHIWVQDKLPWIVLGDDLPRFPQEPA